VPIFELSVKHKKINATFDNLYQLNRLRMKYSTSLFTDIFVLLAIVTGALHAQESIRIGDDQNQFITALDREVGQEAIFYGDSLKVVDLTLFKIIEAKKLHYPDKAQLSDLTALYLSHKLYLFSNEGGEVYQLVNDSLQRIDKSFSHKMQQGSYLSEYRGEAYRYGGYGFWSFRNFFTNYNPDTQGWEIVSPEGSKVFPQGSGNGTLAHVIEDNCYVFGGEEVNLKTPITFQPNKSFWVFHILTREWEFLGEINPKLTNSKYMVIMGDHDQLLFLNQHDTRVLDLKNNLMTSHKNRPIAINLYSGSDDHRICDYGYNGNYYLLFKLNSQDSGRSLYKEKRIFTNPIVDKEEIYISHPWQKTMVIGLVLLLVGLIIFLGFSRNLKTIKKKNQIQILDGKLMYEQRILDLDPKQLELMQLFMLSKELSSNEILAVINNEHLHHTQNIRHMHTLIDELNMKLRLLTDETTDLIREEKSEIDRRIKIYKINRIYVG